MAEKCEPFGLKELPGPKSAIQALPPIPPILTHGIPKPFRPDIAGAVDEFGRQWIGIVMVLNGCLELVWGCYTHMGPLVNRCLGVLGQMCGHCRACAKYAGISHSYDMTC